jgi:uncharacterized membrane-anchored protein YitT (DUF2179 family)
MQLVDSYVVVSFKGILCVRKMGNAFTFIALIANSVSSSLFWIAQHSWQEENL